MIRGRNAAIAYEHFLFFSLTQIIPPARQDRPTYYDDGTVTNDTSVLDEAKRAGNLFPGRDPREGNKEYYDGGLRHCTASCLLTRRYYRGGRLLRYAWDWRNESSGAADSPTDMQAEDIKEFLHRIAYIPQAMSSLVGYLKSFEGYSFEEFITDDSLWKTFDEYESETDDGNLAKRRTKALIAKQIQAQSDDMITRCYPFNSDFLRSFAQKIFEFLTVEHLPKLTVVAVNEILIPA